MTQNVMRIVLACGVALGTMVFITIAHTEQVRQEMEGFFDRVRFTYDGKPLHTQSIAGDAVVKSDLPPKIIEAFEELNLHDQMEIEIGLYGDAQTKAVLVDMVRPKLLRHEGDLSSPIAEGYSARWTVDWMWATDDMTAGVAGAIEGTVYEDGKAKHFRVPLLIEAEANDGGADADERSFQPFVATLRWGNVRLVDVED